MVWGEGTGHPTAGNDMVGGLGWSVLPAKIRACVSEPWDSEHSTQLRVEQEQSTGRGPDAASGPTAVLGLGLAWDVAPCKDMGRPAGNSPRSPGLGLLSQPLTRGDRDSEPRLVSPLGEGVQS